MTITDKMIERARKLLAMSKDASSENEAMTAARQLQALLAKHNISMMDVERAEYDVGEELVGGEYSTEWPWKKIVAYWVAQMCFCSLYIVKVRKNYCGYMVVGETVSREYAKVLIENIFAVVEREAYKACKQHHGKVVSGFISSFRNGAAERIYVRCKKIIEDGKAGLLDDDEGNRLPALVSAYDKAMTDVNDFLASKNLRKNSTRVRAGDSSGLAAGRRLGDSVVLSRGIQGTKGPELLK